jgi:beta-glucosidase-like glycosyl hydrolase
MPDPQLSTLAALNAMAFAAAGINVALGPTVDTSTDDPRTADRAKIVIGQLKRFGLTPVLKHFPFLPATANLHRSSPDTQVPLGTAEERFSIFQQLSTEAGIMMTTHLYDSSVDTTLATFSTAWNALLRRQTGFKGLLMTDGLLMLKNYADRSMLAGGPSGAEVAGIDETAVWAARAILAGHDFIIMEGSAAQTERAFNGLLEAACRRTEIGALLRARIHESAARIARWKQDNRVTLMRRIDVTASDIGAVIAALPGDDSDLSKFSFDSSAMARLDAILSAAAVK